MTERQLHLFRGKRQRGIKAPPPSEFKLHCMVVDTLRQWQAPGWKFLHYPAGEERPTMAGARLKRMGVVAGVPDLLLLPPDGHSDMRVHFLEFKRPGGRLTLSQVSFLAWCRSQHYPFDVAYDYKSAIDILKAWGAVRSEVHVQ